MLKKVLSGFAAAAFVFGTVAQTGILKNLTRACCAVCCDHDGDGWDN